MLSKLIKIGFTLGISAIIFFLFSQTQKFDSNEHERFSQNVLKLRAVNADLNKNILKVRYRLLDYYDILVSQLADLQLLHNSLAEIPSSIDESGKREIRQAHEVLGGLLQEKTETLERFKSKNAVLKNSVRYLPAAVHESVRQLGRDQENRKLVANLESLLQDVLEYHLAPSENLEAKIQKQLSILSDSRPTSASNIVTFNEAVEHAQTILEHTSVVNSLTDTLIWVPIWQWGQTLGQTYDRHHTRLVYEADSYRFYLFVAVGVFVVFTLLLIISTPSESKSAHRSARGGAGPSQDDGVATSRLPEPVAESVEVMPTDNLIVTASPADPYFEQRQSGEFQLPTNL